MVKQLLLPLAAVALFIIIVGIFTQKQATMQLAQLTQKATPAAAQNGEVTIAGHNIKVEIARTFNDRAKGLSGRKTLDHNSGMLFVFDAKQTVQNFWMKDMFIPLDIVWIAEGKIVKIDKDVKPPLPGTPDGKLIIYSPGRPIDYVLEVNAKYTDEKGIKVDDPVLLPPGY